MRRRPPTSEPRLRAAAGALLVAVVALLVTLSTRSFAEAAPSYQVIVHPGNPVTSVDRSFLEDAFIELEPRVVAIEVLRRFGRGAERHASLV